MWESRASQLLGTTVGGRYRLLRTIGEGGMGLVFEAEQSDLRRRVAVKVLLDSDPVATERFLQEAHATANLLSPNIVTILDFKAKEGDAPPLIVMELLEGETLSDILLREPRLPIGRAVGIAVQMLNGLATAHRASIVHRDVKPANVFVMAGPLGDVVKLVDFGIAKILQGDVKVETRKGVFPGTPAYVAPEQLRVEKADARTDVYGVGLVLFEMLAGRRPFMHTSFGDLAAAILREEPPPLRTLRPDAPPEMNAIVMRALAKSRDHRFGSAEEMLAALKPFVNHPPGPAAAASGPVVERKRETVPMADAPRVAMATREQPVAPPMSPVTTDNDLTPLQPIRPIAQHGRPLDGSDNELTPLKVRPGDIRQPSQHDHPSAPAFRPSSPDARLDMGYAPSPPAMRVGSAHDLAAMRASSSGFAAPPPPPSSPYGPPPPMPMPMPAQPIPVPPSSSSMAVAAPVSGRGKETVYVKGKPPLAPPLELATSPKRREQSRAVAIVVAVSAILALVGLGLIVFALATH